MLLRSFLLLGALSAGLAAPRCMADDVCQETGGDETSLIQGLLEPEFVLRAQMKANAQKPKATQKRPEAKGNDEGKHPEAEGKGAEGKHPEEEEKAPKKNTQKENTQKPKEKAQEPEGKRPEATATQKKTEAEGNDEGKHLEAEGKGADVKNPEEEEKAPKANAQKENTQKPKEKAQEPEGKRPEAEDKIMQMKAKDQKEKVQKEKAQKEKAQKEKDAAEEKAQKENDQKPKATTTQKAVVKGTKIKANQAGDLPAFFAAIRFDVMLFLLFVTCFVFLHRWYPQILGYRDPQNWKGEEFIPEPTWFAWVSKGVGVSIDTVSYSSGLDAAMLIRYTDLALELMLVFGILHLAILTPIYAFAGGGFAKGDRLSWQGIGNVVYNNTGQTGQPLSHADAAKLPDVQWIFWLVSFFVWFVVVYTQRRLFTCQRDFITRRMSWLLRMKAPRCTTILVEGIPFEYRTDEKFRDFFQTLFPDATIKSAFVVKNLTSTYLPGLISEYKANQLAQLAAEGGGSDAPDEVDVGELKSQANTLKAQIQEEQDKIKKDPPYAHNGFVTFSKRTEMERSVGLKMSASEEEWVVSVPPSPEDVLYHDLEVGEHQADFEQKLGYAAIAGLFFIFMPIVVGISNLALTIEHTPWIKNIVDATGFGATVQGVLSTVGLTVMMSMLPTFLMIIFRMFFTLKADRWGQIQLQEYYFWFLVIFVLLITAIGTNLEATLAKLAQSPFKAFQMLAAAMPVTTHFYLNYCMFQPVTHSMNLTRYFNFLKFWGLKRLYDEETARKMSEPEDQDYYGMGSRSARFTMMLLIGLIFGTICPLMNVVVLFNFCCCRCVYGYLITFVETQKTDQGGPHWYMQTVHTHLGLLIYIVMMTGVLLGRAESKGPGIISAISFLWWFISYRKYKKSLHWESLPYVQLVKDAAKQDNSGKNYEQISLQPIDVIMSKE